MIEAPKSGIDLLGEECVQLVGGGERGWSFHVLLSGTVSIVLGCDRMLVSIFSFELQLLLCDEIGGMEMARTKKR